MGETLGGWLSERLLKRLVERFGEMLCKRLGERFVERLCNRLGEILDPIMILLYAWGLKIWLRC